MTHSQRWVREQGVRCGCHWRVLQESQASHTRLSSALPAATHVLPQQTHDELNSKPHMWNPPPAMRANWRPPNTSTGVALSPVVPDPRPSPEPERAPLRCASQSGPHSAGGRHAGRSGCSITGRRDQCSTQRTAHSAGNSLIHPPQHMARLSDARRPHV